MKRLKIILFSAMTFFTINSHADVTFDKTLQLAQQGDAISQCNVGYMYFNGIGTTQDYTQAVRWWKKGAAQGLVNDYFNLGLAYYLGKGVPVDYVEAAKWWDKAAREGDIDAQYRLGLMYRTGKGVPVDKVKGYALIKLAADNGNDKAKTLLEKISLN